MAFFTPKQNPAAWAMVIFRVMGASFLPKGCIILRDFPRGWQAFGSIDGSAPSPYSNVPFLTVIRPLGGPRRSYGERRKEDRGANSGRRTGRHGREVRFRLPRRLEPPHL